MSRRSMRVLATLSLFLALAGGSLIGPSRAGATPAVASHASEVVGVCGALADTCSGLLVDVVDVTQELTLLPRRAVNASDRLLAASAALGAPVACRDVSRRVTGKNGLGMTLMWHETRVHWCWDSKMVITGGSSYTAQDTPAPCWGYDGAVPTGYSGGQGFGYWDVSRGSKFSCGLGPLGLHRALSAELHVTAGGGAS